MKHLELTILMPCLNEAKTLVACIEKAKAFLTDSGVSGEVLVCDNGSTDGSQALARAAGARLVDVPTRGYGAALSAGIAHAQGAYVVMGDSDDSYDFLQLGDYLAKLREGFDLVMGNRFLGGIEPGAMPQLHRYLGNPVLSFIGRLFFRVDIGDFHCGLRGFRRQSMIDLNLVTTGMEFASEMVAKSALAGYRITEVPTTLRKDGRDHPPHLNTWRDGWRHLRFLLLFCPRWLFLYPGMALFLAGALGGVVLQYGPVNIVSVGLDIHSLLYMSAAVILGQQLIQLALMTKWMGVLSGVVPQPPWLQRWSRHLKLETGLFAGGALFVAGLLWSLRFIFDWGFAGFGRLEPATSMRMAIPAVTLMVLGMQAMAGSAFAAALHFCWQSSARGSKHE